MTRIVVTIGDGNVASVQTDTEGVEVYVVDMDDPHEHYIIGGDPEQHEHIEHWPMPEHNPAAVQLIAEAFAGGFVDPMDYCCGGSYNCTDCPKERDDDDEDY